MPYTEFAWKAEGSHLTHPSPNIAELVGYSSDEVQEIDILDLVAPSHAPVVLGLMNGGPPNQIISRTLSKFILCHKAGHQVCCQMTLICRYDGTGSLAELFGVARQLPDHEQFSIMEGWWIKAPKLARQILNESLVLFPVPA